MTRHNDDKLLGKTNEALDTSLQQISSDTQTNLSAIRHQALAHAMHKTNVWQRLFKPVPIAAVFTICFALVLVFPKVQDSPESSELIAAEQFNDLLLLSELDDETLELIEDIEFADWLSEEMETQAEGSAVETHTLYQHSPSIYSVEKNQKNALVYPLLLGLINA